MIILTGGAGFVGSNILKALNSQGVEDILIVDNLKNATKYENLVGRKFLDYVDKEAFLQLIDSKSLSGVRGVLHQGACTDTLEYDGKYMMANNFEYSKRLLHCALEHRAPFIYASSAAVYGHCTVACEDSGSEAPLNIYGYSKLVFDEYVRRILPSATSTIVGLRYFNVYGPGESHKGKMSSMVYQLFNQISSTGVAKLFGAFGAYGPGEQTRDFIYIKDIVKLNMFFWNRGLTKSIVNAGTGAARSWNDLGRAVIAAVGKGSIQYVEFPPALVEKYQFNTRADLTLQRSLGYTEPFRTLEEGVSDYVVELKRVSAARERIGTLDHV